MNDDRKAKLVLVNQLIKDQRRVLGEIQADEAEEYITMDSMDKEGEMGDDVAHNSSAMKEAMDAIDEATRYLDVVIDDEAAEDG